ncbi:hypothetical protein [Paraburkholderia caledonica]|uniref:Uncharacterized protein n=1 Tax=Paraburkholderia caledonica TaxID=134536 RepID=A0AB73INQ2_9BURK|nr:hypothetical protein [Paraburkholderia caledonica]
MLGSVLIGRGVATTEWPWMSLVAAQKWTGAPVRILVIQRLEMDWAEAGLSFF